MSIRSCVTRSLFLAAGVLSTVAVTAQQPVRRLLSVPAATEARVALTDGATGHHARAEAAGQLPGDTALAGMSLVLKPTAQQDADLTQLILDQQNPSSASYHQWLTPAQFGDRFGVSDADIFLLQSWLQSNGFLVQSVADSRNRIVFTGTASTVEAAFRVHMQRYRRNGRNFFENSDRVQLPASLAAVVGGVDGLSSYRLPAPQATRLVTAQATVSPQYTAANGSHYLVPWDLRQIYGTNALIGAGYDGTGIKIGIIGQSAVDTTQLTYFQQKTGQTVTLPTMVLVPNTGASNRVSGDEGESELDLEYSSGNAPGAAVQFIYTGCTNTSSSTVLNGSTVNCNNNGVFDALTYAVTKNLAPILSLSYGGCEEEDAAYANSTLEPILKQANAQGQTIMVSSGDSGAASCESSSSAKTAVAGLAVSYPASSPYVTGVGGTQLNGDGAAYWSSTNNSYLGSAVGYVPEVAWNDSAAYGFLLSSGGGASQIFTKPTWQVGNGVPADGKRDVPDVAFPSSVAQHAYLTCDADGPCTSGAKSFTLTSGSTRDGGGVGGTSAAAPTFAGMLAIVEQANGGKALGNINPSLYSLAQTPTAGSIFHDIVSGNNVVPCTTGTINCTTGSLGYTTTAGYDQVTGLGSIAIPALQTALAGYAAKTARIQLALSSQMPFAGSAVTFTVTVAGSTATPTGTVTFLVDGQAVATAATLVSGTYTFSYGGFAAAGSHTVSVSYSGDSNYSAGTASVLVEAVAVKPTISLVVTPANLTVNTAATATVTVTGGSSGTPTGSVSITGDSFLGTSIPLVNGSATYSLGSYTTAGYHSVNAIYTPAPGSAFQSVSSSVVLTVKASTQTLTPTVQISLSPTAVAASAALSLSVQVSGSGSAPTGTVQFLIDGTSVGTTAVVGGTGTLSVTAPGSGGSHTVQALYFGNSIYLSASASSTFTVSSPGASIAVTPGTLNVNYGSTGTATVTITSSAGLSGTTNLTLSLVSYTGATFSGCYSLSPRSLALPANGTVTGALTMYTTASSCSATGLQRLESSAAVRTGATTTQATVTRIPGRVTWALLPAAAFGMLLFRRRLRPAALLLVFLAAAGSFALSGCGSGSSSSTTTTTGTGTGTGTTTTTTPSANAGSYVIRVTASTAAASGTVTSNTTFTLNVQ